MAQSTGYILAAAGIVIANELVFAPVVANEPLFHNFNWRILPATAIAAASLAGLEALSPPLGKGLAILALLAVLIRPVGNAPSPVENAAKFLGVK
jgi:hypothetical protein